MIEQEACVRLELDNRPENVAVVRAALTGVAEAVGFHEELTTDLKTAVSEACNNVVMHAYEGGQGPMRVLVSNAEHTVDVVVSDEGTGITRLSSGPDHMGLGLALISALADQVEFRGPPEGGTEVRIRFRRTDVDTGAGFTHNEAWPSRPEALAAGDVVMWCRPVPLVRHVMGRVARAAAAGSHFTITGASDLYAINDAMAGFAEMAADGHLVVGISSSPHRLTLDAGPLVSLDALATARTTGADASPGALQSSEATGTAGALDPFGALQTQRAKLAQLVDQLSFESFEGGELMRLLVLDRGR